MKWRAILYGWPEASLLFFVVGLLAIGFISLYRYRQVKLASLAEPRLLSLIQAPRSKIAYWIKSLLFCVAWICAVLALMQPYGNGRYPLSPLEQATKPTPKPQKIRQIAQNVVFLMDASASMAIADARTGKRRLDEAKEIAEEIISRLHGEDVAVYAFTSATMQLVPLTTDYLFTRLMLRQLSINEGETKGTNFLQALESMHKLFFSAASDRHTALVVLTDGEDTHFEALPASQRENYLQGIAKLIANSDIKNVNMYFVGIGSTQGGKVPDVAFQGQPVISKLNVSLLSHLSLDAGGQLFLSKDLTIPHIADAVLEGLKSHQQFADKIVSSPRINASQDELRYDLYFQFPLALAILALALALLLPETRRKLRI